MHSWVRYSVAVYLGLLLAGAILGPTPQRTIGVEPDPAKATRPAIAAPVTPLATSPAPSPIVAAANTPATCGPPQRAPPPSPVPGDPR